MTDASIMAGLYRAAPGPRTAAMAFAGGAGQVLRGAGVPRLDAHAAQGTYHINRTKVAEAEVFVRCLADTALLAEIVRRERRASVVTVALANPCTPLAAWAPLLKGCTPVKPWNVGSCATHLRAAVGAEAARVGMAAAVETLLAIAVGHLSYLLDHAIGSLPGVGDDLALFSRLVRDGRTSVAGAVLDRGDASVEVVRHAAAHGSAPLRDVVAANAAWLARDPGLIDVLLDAAQRDLGTHTSGPGTRHPSAGVERLELLLARRVRSAEHVARLVSGGRTAVLAELAARPDLDVALLADVAVSGRAHQRAVVAGRLVADRFGDDEAAFALVADLIPGFDGTYGALVELVGVALARPAAPAG